HLLNQSRNRLVQVATIDGGEYTADAARTPAIDPDFPGEPRAIPGFRLEPMHILDRQPEKSTNPRPVAPPRKLGHLESPLNAILEANDTGRCRTQFAGRRKIDPPDVPRPGWPFFHPREMIPGRPNRRTHDKIPANEQSLRHSAFDKKSHPARAA